MFRGAAFAAIAGGSLLLLSAFGGASYHPVIYQDKATILHIHEKEDNPGKLDDPACRAFIIAQCKSVGVDPKSFSIVYYGTQDLSDGEGALNTYVLTNLKGQKLLVAVAYHVMKVSEDPQESTPGQNTNGD